jgi:hypothetical protein
LGATCLVHTHTHTHTHTRYAIYLAHTHTHEICRICRFPTYLGDEVEHLRDRDSGGRDAEQAREGEREGGRAFVREGVRPMKSKRKRRVPVGRNSMSTNDVLRYKISLLHAPRTHARTHTLP